MEIQGKVAVVTGAAAGIGRGTAVALAQAGAATVVVVDVDQGGGAETAAQVVSAGADAWVSCTDVSSIEAQRELFRAIEERHGGLDILHNNAGVMSGEPAWPETSPERLSATIGVNLTGVVLGTRAAIDLMKPRGGGAIVNTASRAALSTNRYDPVYHATKAAVVSFTQSCRFLANEAGIRVNAVLPGVVDTPILAKTGDGRSMAAWLQPLLSDTVRLDVADISVVVLELISDDHRVGECVVVDNPPGGMYAVEWGDLHARR